MNSNLREFLKRKFSNSGIMIYVLNDVNNFAASFVSWTPGILGMIFRNIIYRALFKRVKGILFIQPNVRIDHFNRISIGKNFGCNSFTYINGVGSIEIGNDVLIGNNVTISSGRHSIDNLKGSIFSNPAEMGKIVIEDGVWIGAGVVILPGVKLASGSVIGANSVVTIDTESNCVYMGLPAKKIRQRIME